MAYLKKSVLLCLLVLLSGLLFACSDNSSSNSSPSSGTAPAQSVSVSSALDPEISLAPNQTVSQENSVPTVGYTPKPTIPAYSTLTPPRELVPATETPIAPLESLPGNQFVVATNTGLYLLSQDGKDYQTLVAGASFNNPQVSPDGTRIAAFRVDPVTFHSQLYLVSSSGELSPVTETGGTVLNAAWSPDGKTLALTRVTDTNGDGTADDNDSPSIWLYDIKADHQQEVADGANPAWSPDGARLAFVIPGPYNDDQDSTTHKPLKSPNSLGIYNLQQNAKRVLLDTKKLSISLPASLSGDNLENPANIRYFKAVSWTPDGNRITASADAQTGDETNVGVVVTVTLEDVTPKLVAAGGDAAANLTWSADGSKLAYEVEPRFPVKSTSAYQVALVITSGSDSPQKPLQYIGNASNRTEARNPAWIAGGKLLAYLEGDTGVLAVADPSAQITLSSEKRLISGCNGFDWVKSQ